MEFVITIKAEPEEMDTALQAVSRFFAQNFDDGGYNELTPEEIKKQKRSEYDKKRYLEKKVEKCENDVEKCENDVESTLIPQIPQEKEEKKRTKRKEEKEIYINTTSPNGEVQADKKPLKPEDDGFWNFAKENAEMAKQFWLETGIFPVKKEFGRWIVDLRNLSEAGITVTDMQDACIYMRSNNLPIGAPGSILKTARWLKANPQTATRSSPGKDRWDVAAEKIEAEMGNGTLWGYLENESGEVIDI